VSNIETVTIPEFRARLKAQGVNRHEDFAFKCPMCGTVQSGQSLICAGAGKDFDAVEKYVAFSCVGRFTGAGAPRKKPDGKPCNWTLGGLFSTHKLAIVDEQGKAHPRFEIASPDEAQALAAHHAEKSASESEASA